MVLLGLGFGCLDPLFPREQPSRPCVERQYGWLRMAEVPGRKHENRGQAEETKTVPEARNKCGLPPFLAAVELGYLILREDIKLGTTEFKPC